MRLTDFDYKLPKELIAQYPLEDRLSARLLVVRREDASIEHRAFRDIADYLKAEDVLVLNDTRVLPSRLEGQRKTGGRVSILLLNHKSGSTFNILIKPARIKLNEEIIFNGGKTIGTLTSKNEITFSLSRDQVYALGSMPLPPYIKRLPEKIDDTYYQTVYAKRNGAIASPTAGLHFTKEFLQRIEAKGVGLAYITLHVGLSTFKPVKCEDIREHIMEEEEFFIPDSALELINARRNKGRIIAVGTTSCRALETYAAIGKSQGKTSLFIYPGYELKLVDALLTNFHLPRTTLFMLVCAFLGEHLAKKTYQEAVEKKYRFYSYGDAMLIL